jgi:hypothetical protein
MLNESTDPEWLQKVYQQTDIKRIPITGFLAGYHSLPFTLIGPNPSYLEEGKSSVSKSLKLTGKINVSPKLIFSFSHEDERFQDIFPEAEPFMDQSLVGRVFSFQAGNKKNLKIRNEEFQVEEFPDNDEELLKNVIDDLNRSEIINMGVIWCPQPRFYPVSLERFIVSILDREFR